MSYPGARKLGDHLKIPKAKEQLRVIDIAAGSGIWGIAVAQRSPQVRVTAVDWAGMIPTTKPITENLVCAIVSISLKETCQRQTLAVATISRRLVHILHSEGEQRDRRLLKETFRALKSGRTIAVAEWLVK